MATTALVLFALAAAGGLVLAVRYFKGLSFPLPVTLLHGALAASGIVLLLLTYFGASGGVDVGTPLLILVVAALGGFFLVSFHLRGRRPPSAAVVIHALVAVTGFLTLLAVVF